MPGSQLRMQRRAGHSFLWGFMAEEVKGEKTEQPEGASPKEPKDDLEERIKAAVLVQLESYQKDNANLKRDNANLKRDNTRYKKALTLDEEQLANLIDSNDRMDRLRADAGDLGVPEHRLTGRDTPAALQEIIEIYKELKTPDNSLDADAVSTAAAKVVAQVRGTGPSSERVASHPVGASAGPGKENYAELLKSGKPMPSAAEIDRMTAKYVS